MADYTSRTITTVRRQYEVPTSSPWGAPADEISKAWDAALNDYRKAHDLAADAPIPGDALRFHPADDRIVIAFTLSETADV
ncbi:MAG TPA: hypothetical protein VFH77_17425 [Streptomyces sp.]|nr:hypothetical protein [Streptomyces sp.]